MTPRPLLRGPYEQRVVDNVRSLRNARHFASLHELSVRLTECGWPIPEISLSRLVAGKRRISVDDAIALAYALNVEPADLIFRKVSVGVVVSDAAD